jgi:acyl dehydratase
MGGDAGDKGLKPSISSCCDRRPFDVGKFIGVAGVRTATEKRALVAAGLTGDDQRAD